MLMEHKHCRFRNYRGSSCFLLVSEIFLLSPQKVLYHVLYCFISLAGIRWNIFYFSIHLIDLMMESKVLLAILRSVLINARQVYT